MNTTTQSGVQRKNYTLQEMLSKARGTRTLRNIVEIAESRGQSLSYEGYRKIETGMTHPSDTTLKKLAITLDLDYEELLRVARESFVREKLGANAFQSMVEVSSELSRLNELMRMLTPEQTSLIVSMAETLAQSSTANMKYAPRRAAQGA